MIPALLLCVTLVNAGDKVPCDLNQALKAAIGIGKRAHYEARFGALTEAIEDNHYDDINRRWDGDIGEDHQYLIAAAVQCQWSNGAPDFQLAERDSLFYRNKHFDAFTSRDDGKGKGNILYEIRTKKHSEARFYAKTKVHTELQFLYGRRGEELIKEAQQKNWIILIISWYIPCSQNVGSKGECAGDMAEYLAEQNTKAKFVVAHGGPYKGSEQIKPNECVSRLYMSKAGILSYQIFADKDDNLYLKFRGPESGVEAPHFQALPRVDDPDSHSRLELMTLCLFRADFVPLMQELNQKIGTRLSYNRPNSGSDIMLILLDFLYQYMKLTNPAGDFRKILGQFSSAVQQRNADAALPIKTFETCVDFVDCYGKITGSSTIQQTDKDVIDYLRKANLWKAAQEHLKLQNEKQSKMNLERLRRNTHCRDMNKSPGSFCTLPKDASPDNTKKQAGPFRFTNNRKK